MSGAGASFTGGKARDFNFNFDDLFKHFESDIFGGEDMKGHFRSHLTGHFAAHHQAMGGEFEFEKMFEVDKKLKETIWEMVSPYPFSCHFRAMTLVSAVARPCLARTSVETAIRINSSSNAARPLHRRSATP
jgi:hypothetical protein